MKHKLFSAISYVLCGLFFAFNFILPQNTGAFLPDRIYVDVGKQAQVEFTLPIWASLSTSDGTELSVNGSPVSQGKTISLNQGLTIASDKAVDTELVIKLGNLFTLKRIQVTASDDIMLYPGGQSIGVAMYTKGALVVATGEFTNQNGEVVSPGKEAGLLLGDIVLMADGKEVKGADMLSSIISNRKEALSLRIIRQGEEQEISILPQMDASDNRYKMGLWVRDSTAGIGTMTFIDPKTMGFGSLGHAITDVDLREVLLLRTGEIIPATVFDVIPGQVGKPGELCGTFMENEKSAGTISKNTDFGIFGTANRILGNDAYDQPLPIAFQSEIRTGPCTILSTIDDGGVKEYDCEIVRINRQKNKSTKGLVIKVTDPRLLETTGGIVQGMSGSPILQNGKIVGAVTHVFINDPQRGYGVFIEWMLEELQNP